MLRKLHIRVSTFFVLLLSAIVINTSVVQAAPGYNCATRARSLFILTSWDTYLPCNNAVGVYIGSLQDAGGLVYWVVDSLLKLSAYIAIGFVIWGSIKFIKAQGEPSEIADARTTIINALIGLAICITSVAIVQFVAGIF